MGGGDGVRRPAGIARIEIMNWELYWGIIVIIFVSNIKTNGEQHQKKVFG